MMVNTCLIKSRLPTVRWTPYISHNIEFKNIDQTKATGRNKLSARILKETANEIAGVMSVIFQQSYEDGTVPSDGSPANPFNYRPVSLTCTTCNVMEHIIYSQITTSYCIQTNMVSERVYLARRNLSTPYMNCMAYAINQ